MAIDAKYGQVTLERGNIPDDEPVIVFRAQDKLAPKVLAYYAFLCIKERCETTHVYAVLKAKEWFDAWQDQNTAAVKKPD